ncbi:hypothetical protein PGIGA_G00053040 [Pangasianodon gigas]|uniref:Uncharacterized protein n=1 Tax=Pangasianodon gigas TaxID=30993 RepID=A0ACC5X3Q5_PANGG|nr:hypothetical protein [Pangasianodon gigas]
MKRGRLKTEEVKSPAQLQPEADRAASHAEFPPEADRAASSPELQPKADKAASQALFLPEADDTASHFLLKPEANEAASQDLLTTEADGIASHVLLLLEVGSTASFDPLTPEADEASHAMLLPDDNGTVSRAMLTPEADGAASQDLLTTETNSTASQALFLLPDTIASVRSQQEKQCLPWDLGFLVDILGQDRCRGAFVGGSGETPLGESVSFHSAVISSIVVLNKTIPLHGSHGQHTGLHRVALKEHVSNQRIIFRVNGNASATNIKCFRSNGLSAHTVGMALVFAQQVSESDAGLYTCITSWYHHNATVTVLVEVTSQEIHSMMLILICFSSAVAIALILMITLCIFCKRNEETHSSTQDWKKRESLAALMQDPRSPDLKKARGKGQEYAELVHYSIVIDVKSMV